MRGLSDGECSPDFSNKFSNPTMNFKLVSPNNKMSNGSMTNKSMKMNLRG